MATQNVRKRNPIKPDDGRLKANKAKNNAPPPKVQLLRPLPWQKAMLAAPDSIPVTVLAGGRAGGKTTALVIYILREVARHGKNFNGVLLRRDLTGLKRITSQIEEQMNLIPGLQGSTYRVGDKHFEFANGANLRCGFIRDERSFQKWQGDDLTFLALDEAAQLPDPAPMLRLMSSMRTTAVGVVPKVILTCNPNNPGSWWVYEHVISKLTSFQPGYVDLFGKQTLLITSTLFDNDNLADPDAYIETLKASCNGDEAKIASEVFGSWSVISGTFFSHAFSEHRSKVKLPDRIGMLSWLRPEDCWLAMDWGTRSPSALLLMFKAPQRMQVGDKSIPAGSVVVVDEIYTCTKTADGQRLWNTGDRSLTVSKFAEMAHNLCLRNGIAFDRIRKRQRVADAAIGSEIGSDYGSIGRQLKHAGAEFVAGPKLGRAEGWQRLITLMEAAGDPTTPGLYVSVKCDSLWQLLPRLTYDERKPEDLDTTQPDHSADALRYGITAMDDPRYRGVVGRTDLRVW